MGIYVHIPFCQSKCYYCGFYSVASMQLKSPYIGALCKEAELRKDYLGTEKIRTLYFGGGTPSCLSLDELDQIVINLERIYPFEKDMERTIEVNPEDVTPAALNGWLALGFNRLSIGVQSFHDEVLKRINRRHTGERAITAVEDAYRSGFRNIGIDLILGLPGYTEPDLYRDLEIIRHLPITHLSVYMLSIDPGTVFEHRLRNGSFFPENDDVVAGQYLFVCDYLKSIGFEHYEISNFAKDFKYSQHNTAYWKQRKYIGLGAAAHSYNGHSRQWNTAHIKNYIDGLDENKLNFEQEVLTETDCLNEYLMTSLRTKWGVDSYELKSRFPQYGENVLARMLPYLEKGLFVQEDHRIFCSERGWLLSDGIFADLFEV